MYYTLVPMVFTLGHCKNSVCVLVLSIFMMLLLNVMAHWAIICCLTPTSLRAFLFLRTFGDLLMFGLTKWTIRDYCCFLKGGWGASGRSVLAFS